MSSYADTGATTPEEAIKVDEQSYTDQEVGVAELLDFGDIEDVRFELADIPMSQGEQDPTVETQPKPTTTAGTPSMQVGGDTGGDGQSPTPAAA